MPTTSSTPRKAAIQTIAARSALKLPHPNASDNGTSPPRPTSEYFGINTFGVRQMRDKLPKRRVREARRADPPRQEARPRHRADASRRSIKEWAIARGATHFTHWFQPQTGLTAEKHDAFLTFDDERPADRAVHRRAAHPERARRVELPVGRPARDLGSARLHGVESGEPGVHRRVGRRAARCASRRCSSATTAKRSTR